MKTANSDYVFIEGFEVAVHVGTTEQERAFPQILRLSLRLGLPLEKVGLSDKLSDSVDYAAVANQIRTAIDQKKFQLVETVAQTVAEIALTFSEVLWVEIRVAKKVFAGIDAVGSFIRREKK